MKFADLLNSPLPSKSGAIQESASEDMQKKTAEFDKEAKAKMNKMEIDRIKSTISSLKTTMSRMSGDSSKAKLQALIDEQEKKLAALTESAGDKQFASMDPVSPEFKGVEQDYPADGKMTPGRCPNNTDVKAKEPPTVRPPLETPDDVSEDGVGSDMGVPMPPMGDDPMMDGPAPSMDDSSAPLTPDESRHVDDTMNAVATPMLLADELDECDMKEFVESVDCDIAIAEGFLTEKTIVKFDKNAKRAQLYEVAIAAVAREKNDPLYRKLETVYKMERILKAKLRKKYHSQANAKVKEYLKRAQGSKSGILARIAAKISGK